MNIRLCDIAGAVDGALEGGDPERKVSMVSVDSRTIRPGEAFFALKGPNFDGHRFINDAFERGAACAVAGSSFRDSLPDGFCVIAVADTFSALGRLASYVRGLYNIPVIAISGSSGKTTTKEMTASILGRSRRVLKTEGNRNNLVGLPLTLFGLDRTHEAAVLELGISEPWEMERLVKISSPDAALITNIGRGHLKTLGSLEGVAKAKAALFERLNPGGVKVVNLDDPWAVRISGLGRGRGTHTKYGSGGFITYSIDKDADVTVRKEGPALDGIDVTYGVRGADVTVRLNTIGPCNISNGAAAIAASLALGASVKDMEEGLSGLPPLHGRMEVVRINGVTILDDTYNANPDSVVAALKTLKAAGGRKVAVLGDMLELGEASAPSHREVGALAAALSIDILVAIGLWSKETTEGALSSLRYSGRQASGLAESSVRGFGEKKEAALYLNGILRKGDTVLIKGSRAIGLETIVEGLKNGPRFVLA